MAKDSTQTFGGYGRISGFTNTVLIATQDSGPLHGQTLNLTAKEKLSEEDVQASFDLNTMLDDVGLSLNLLQIFVQHFATLLAQQCCMMLASFEQAFTV